MCPSAPQSVTPWWPAALVLLHRRPGPAQGHFWCSGFAGEANFLVHLVILLVVRMFYPSPSPAMRWTSLYSNFVFPPSPPSSKQQDWDSHYGEFFFGWLAVIIIEPGVHNPCISGGQALWNKVSVEILQSIPSQIAAAAIARINLKNLWYEI